MYARAPIPKREPPHEGGIEDLIGMPRWPAAIVVVATGLIYFFVSGRFRFGPPWLLLALEAVLYLPLIVTRQLGLHHLTRKFAVLLTGVLTLAVSSSAAYLVARLLGGREPAPGLLRNAALIWVFNVLVFAVWYWEIDAGGPGKRRRGHHASTDFVFPQMALDDAESRSWSPEFFDYLFLAFNTSVAFSPTDTLVLSRPVKALMMYQALVSLVIISVLIARGINTLT